MLTLANLCDIISLGYYKINYNIVRLCIDCRIWRTNMELTDKDIQFIDECTQKNDTVWNKLKKLISNKKYNSYLDELKNIHLGAKKNHERNAIIIRWENTRKAKTESEFRASEQFDKDLENVLNWYAQNLRGTPTGKDGFNIGAYISSMKKSEYMVSREFALKLAIAFGFTLDETRKMLYTLMSEDKQYDINPKSLSEMVYLLGVEKGLPLIKPVGENEEDTVFYLLEYAECGFLKEVFGSTYSDEIYHQFWETCKTGWLKDYNVDIGNASEVVNTAFVLTAFANGTDVSLFNERISPNISKAYSFYRKWKIGDLPVYTAASKYKAIISRTLEYLNEPIAEVKKIENDEAEIERLRSEHDELTYLMQIYVSGLEALSSLHFNDADSVENAISQISNLKASYLPYLKSIDDLNKQCIKFNKQVVKSVIFDKKVIQNEIEKCVKGIEKSEKKLKECIEKKYVREKACKMDKALYCKVIDFLKELLNNMLQVIGDDANAIRFHAVFSCIFQYASYFDENSKKLERESDEKAVKSIGNESKRTRKKKLYFEMLEAISVVVKDKIINRISSKKEISILDENKPLAIYFFKQILNCIEYYYNYLLSKDSMLYKKKKGSRYEFDKERYDVLFPMRHELFYVVCQMDKCLEYTYPSDTHYQEISSLPINRNVPVREINPEFDGFLDDMETFTIDILQQNLSRTTKAPLAFLKNVLEGRYIYGGLKPDTESTGKRLIVRLIEDGLLWNDDVWENIYDYGISINNPLIEDEDEKDRITINKKSVENAICESDNQDGKNMVELVEYGICPDSDHPLTYKSSLFYCPLNSKTEENAEAEDMCIKSAIECFYSSTRLNNQLRKHIEKYSRNDIVKLCFWDFVVNSGKYPSTMPRAQANIFRTKFNKRVAVLAAFSPFDIANPHDRIIHECLCHEDPIVFLQAILSVNPKLFNK